jgi:hypothetical protein
LSQEKRKRSTQNPLSYWWNELLFARHVEIESDLDLDQLMDTLLAMEHGRRGFFWGLLRTSETQIEAGGKELTFKIQSRRKRWGDLFSIATAVASGNASVDPVTGRAQIRYKVTFGGFLHLMMLFYLFTIAVLIVPMILSEAGATFIFVPLLWMLFFAIYWGILYRDRNQLAADIQQQALTPPAAQAANFSYLSQQDRADDSLREIRSQAQHKKR